jgi:hypothetical protein
VVFNAIAVSQSAMTDIAVSGGVCALPVAADTVPPDIAQVNLNTVWFDNFWNDMENETVSGDLEVIAQMHADAEMMVTPEKKVSAFETWLPTKTEKIWQCSWLHCCDWREEARAPSIKQNRSRKDTRTAKSVVVVFSIWAYLETPFL